MTLIAMLPFLNGVSPSVFSDWHKKELIARVEKCPNYIFHLMAVAKVGSISDYAETYKHSVVSDDLSYIQKHEELLSFKSGARGELVFIAIFFPSYISLPTAGAYDEYYSLLDSGSQTSDFQPFLEKYGPFVRKLNAWFPIDEQSLNSIKKHREIVASLGEIYLRNCAAYEKQVWNTEKIELDKVAMKVNDHFRDRDLIYNWEALTGAKFKFDNCYVVLCSAIKNGPNANSLGYGRTVFYHFTPFNYMTQVISHEIGTHILIDVYKELSRLDQFESGVLYAAYESLAEFYNSIILGNESLEYSLPAHHDKEYLRIYDDTYVKHPGITPRDLLVTGIEILRRYR